MTSRASKRKRVSERKAGLLPIEDKHRTFTQWAKDQGVEISGVQAARIPNRGIGLITTKRIKEGDTILTIPEKAMFKPDATLLKRAKLSGASPQAQLAFSAMVAFGSVHYSLGVWKDVWPAREDFEASMPMCWPESLRGRLPPPVQHPLARQLADYGKDWKAVEAACAQLGFDENTFKYYWMIVNSRSFHWKPPVAKGGTMVMCPFIDYLNHGPTSFGCHVSQDSHGYEVAADRTYEPGEEILATYGSHSNDKLLVHYGFTCSTPQGGPSPDDELRLDHLIIPKLTPEVCDQLQDVGFLGGYSLSASTNELCFKTEVAIRAVLLTSNEWEYFIANGEDLSEDRSAEVEKFVKTLLIEYQIELESTIRAMEVSSTLEEHSGNELMRSRWKEFGRIIDSFVQS